MAVLPLLLQGKSGMCKHTDFVEFISVSIISFMRTFKSGYDFSLKQMFASHGSHGPGILLEKLLGP